MGMVDAASTDAKNPSWDPDVLVRLYYLNIIRSLF
jgi:hypothetical protein